MRNIYLVPRPQKVEVKQGDFVLPHKGVILLDSRELDFASRRLQQLCQQICGQKLDRRLLTKSPCRAAFRFRKSEDVYKRQIIYHYGASSKQCRW